MTDGIGKVTKPVTDVLGKTIGVVDGIAGKVKKIPGLGKRADTAFHAPIIKGKSAANLINPTMDRLRKVKRTADKIHKTTRKVKKGYGRLKRHPLGFGRNLLKHTAGRVTDMGYRHRSRLGTL